MNTKTNGLLLATLLVAVADANQADYDWDEHLKDLEETLKLKKEARANGEQDTYINRCKVSYHRLSPQAMANKVCKEHGYAELASPVYLLLTSCWNDALRWAKTEYNLQSRVPQASIDWEAKMDALYDQYR